MNLIRLIGTTKFRIKMLPLVKWGFLVAGRSWNDFYRWMLNLQERNTTLDMIFKRRGKAKPGEKIYGLAAWGLGDDHLAFMKKHGLKPEHRVLDFGCGYGRTCIPLLKYLEPDNYVGAELSDKRIDLAKEWVEREALTDTHPLFFVSTDNSMPYLEDSSVDAIWTLSVFTHMPEREQNEVLASFKRVLRPGGAAYFHYNAPIPGAPRVKPATLKDFPWETETIERNILSHGFSIERMEDWEDALDPKMNRVSTMLRLTV